jgi:NAD(P)-dependent dehydrogenase (short-subunit alcohol dehydrogenase family)
MAQQYLKGKTAIVTGAGKPNGIGAASAIALAGQGANVRRETLSNLNSD